jgi:hypothetical protein
VRGMGAAPERGEGDRQLALHDRDCARENETGLPIVIIVVDH